MKKKDFDLSQTEYIIQGDEFPENDLGLPQVIYLPPPKDKILYLDHIIEGKKRAFPRLGCYGSVIFFDRIGRIVAKGKMLDINEISCGIELGRVDLRVDDVLYLRFTSFYQFRMRQVKVILRRVHGTKFNTRVGVEFVDTTLGFRKRLAEFLKEKRDEDQGFKDFNII